MKSAFIYTSPARGHLFPVLPLAGELANRNHCVSVSCLADEVPQVRSLGLNARPLDPRVEAREMDDWRGKNPMEALDLAMRTFADRRLAPTSCNNEAAPKRS